MRVTSQYRGEVRPRRRPPRHNIVMYSAAHKSGTPDDPFAPISSAQFPALYQRNPVKNVYRSYMRSKSIYQRHHS